MPKRIEFIAPVEAVRGNLSGAQNLKYPTDNQGAYEGPVGSTNYARNYTPRYIGAKRASDGRKYFSVRTKTANHLTPKAKTAMALLGGVGAIVASILRDKSATIYTNLHGAWIKSQEMGGTSTFREFLSGVVRRMLVQKLASIHVQVAEYGQDIDNPWNTSSTTPNVTVSQAVLVKFWPELAKDGVILDVEGQKIIAHSSDTFADIIASGYNILNLESLSGVPGAQSLECVVSAGSTTTSGSCLKYQIGVMPAGFVGASDEVANYLSADTVFMFTAYSA